MPRRQRQGRGLQAFVWIIGLIVISLVASLAVKSCKSDNEADEKPKAEKTTNKPIGTKGLQPKDVTVTGQKIPTDITATPAATAVKSPYNTVADHKQLNNSRQKGTDAYLEELSPILEIGPSGKLPAPMQVTIKLDRKVDVKVARQGQPQDKVYIATNATHKADGWVPVEAQVSPDGWHATITVDHLSWFQALWSNVTGMWNELKTQFLDGMTSGVFASAKQPTCQNESKARQDDYRINSDSKDTIYWCFGVEKNERIVRIVNNRKYPLEVKTNNLTKIDHDTVRLEFVDLLRAMGQQFLMPGDSMAYKVALKHDARATIDTDISKSALGVHSVETVTKSLITLIAKVDTSKPGNAAEMIKAIAKKGDCLGVLGTMNMGDLIAKCFDKDFLFENFGPTAMLLAPVMAVFAIASVGQSLWDAYNDGKSGKATYNVTVTRPKPNPFGPFIGTWGRHLSYFEINADGTGHDHTGSGAGGTEGCGTGDDYCSFEGDFRVTANADGSLTATYTKVWAIFRGEQQVSMPPSYKESRPHVGEQVTIKQFPDDTILIQRHGSKAQHDMDITVGGKSYRGFVWCGPNAGTNSEAAMYCGA